jgi:hypothetical protein
VSAEIIEYLGLRDESLVGVRADNRAHTVADLERGAQRSGGPNYGSEGWGFESLRAHSVHRACLLREQDGLAGLDASA